MSHRSDPHGADAARAPAPPLIHIDPDFHYPARTEPASRRFLRALRHLFPQTS